tara:strand:- start:149 stop:724 length:576 start_codon:yes stop_codon:yes gene_type:complete
MTPRSRPSASLQLFRSTLLSRILVSLFPLICIAFTGESSNLISDNPFVPIQKKSNTIINKPGPPQNTPIKTDGVLSKYLEFKSVAIINKKKYYSIYNRRTNKSLWLPENQTIESYRATKYDPETGNITISDGINSERITIATSDEKPINVITNPAKSEENKELKLPKNQQNNQTQKRQPIPRRRVVTKSPK